MYKIKRKLLLFLGVRNCFFNSVLHSLLTSFIQGTDTLHTTAKIYSYFRVQCKKMMFFVYVCICSLFNELSPTQTK
jgi:hypothetical protein